MYVYSGKCRKCETGQVTGFFDVRGKPLHTGDIVIPYTISSEGPEYIESLTVVVSDQYTSYSNGTHIKKDGEQEFFVMGIKGVDLDSPGTWRVLKVKSFEHVINGESWPEYGFNFRDE